MSPPDASVVVRLANQFARQPKEPYDGAELQALCNALEVVLRGFLAEESQWSRYDWLDGFVATNVARTSEHLVIRGAVWVNAARTEPCEVDIDIPHGGTAKATIRFACTETPSKSERPEKLKFPRQDWLYVFQFAA